MYVDGLNPDIQKIFPEKGQLPLNAAVQKFRRAAEGIAVD